MKGTVPFCINVQGVYKGLEVEAMRAVAEKMSFRTKFLDSTNSRYKKKTGQWTNGTIKMVR